MPPRTRGPGPAEALAIHFERENEMTTTTERPLDDAAVLAFAQKVFADQVIAKGTAPA